MADTASPPRNFTLGTAERVSAAIAGSPAYVRRLRAIEDLHARLAARCAEDGGPDATAEARAAFLTELARLNDLIERHNRYYPAERNLPSDPRTGAILDRGRPWRPLAPVTEASLKLAQRAP